MNKEKLTTIGVVILILLVAGGVIFFKNTSLTVKDIPSEKVAKWIGEHSVLYFSPSCPHCLEQEKIFGSNLKYLNMVDCTKEENRQKCIEALGSDLRVPTWIIDGQKYVGVQSIEKLKELTGYQDK